MKLFHQGCDLGAAISSFWNSGSKLYLNVGSQLTVMKYSWITISNSTSKYSSEYKINFPKKYISLCNSLKKKQQQNFIIVKSILSQDVLINILAGILTARKIHLLSYYLLITKIKNKVENMTNLNRKK